MPAPKVYHRAYHGTRPLHVPHQRQLPTRVSTGKPSSLSKREGNGSAGQLAFHQHSDTPTDASLTSDDVTSTAESGGSYGSPHYSTREATAAITGDSTGAHGPHGGEEQESLSAPEPVSTVKYYKQLKAVFDDAPVCRDTRDTLLLSYEAEQDRDENEVGPVDSSSPVSQEQCEAAPTHQSEPHPAEQPLSASVKDFNLRKHEESVVQERAQLPHATFAFTEFTEAISGEDLVEPAATLLAERIRTDDAEHSVGMVVSAGVRGCGALAHAVALQLGVPYSLANWYPDGSVGDNRVDRCQGIGGPGWVYLNGIPNDTRVVVVLDVVRTGVTAARLVEGVQGVQGCSVLGVYAVGAMVGWRPAADPKQPLGTGSDASAPSPAHACAAVSGEEDPRLNAYVRHCGRPHGATGPPPLRALLLISHAGERTHVLTRREREEEWQASLAHEQQMRVHAAATQAAIPSSVRRAQRWLTSLYEWCFPTVCPPPRRFPRHAVNAIRRMTPQERQQKQRRVAASFTGVPIFANKQVGGYPYCFFALTDFKPALTPSLVEDMADLAVALTDLRRCEVLVSEGDRGGAPLLHAISLRTHLPYVIASWSLPSASQGTSASPVTSAASGTVHVGFGGRHCQLSLAGLPRGARCLFVDDMLSSGGTAEAVLRCIGQLGAHPVGAVFAAEKLYPAPPRRRPHGGTEGEGNHGTPPSGVSSGAGEALPRALPCRKGYNRLKELFPETRLTCLSQFVVEEGRTIEPPCRIGE